MMNKNKKYLAGLFLCFIVLFFISLNITSNSSSAQSSPDVIAIRVIPNPEHLSPLRWYQQQNFQGSPQSLLVDGYQAVRNGRTVYVNAANIDTNNGHCSHDSTEPCTIPSTTCPNLRADSVCVPNIYTNIYLISYNQEAESATIDIFGRILSNWKFNTNLGDIGRCSDDINKHCRIDSNCAGDGICKKIGKCSTSGNNCFYTSDCTQAGETCVYDNDGDGINDIIVKAEVVRDVERLADMSDIHEVLKKYGQRGHYPKLSAGTYITNKTVSTWPSWQATLARELGVSSLPLDPINELGYCEERFNSTTCWDEGSREFAGIIQGDSLLLPSQSHALVYSTNPSGTHYDICAVMESGLLTSLDQGACLGSAAPTTVKYSGEIKNHQPEFTRSSVLTSPQCSSFGYEAFIEAQDVDGDEIFWTITETPDASWVNNGWPTPLSLEDTQVDSIKKIYFSHVGKEGDYMFDIEINDKRGGVVTKTATVKVVPPTVPLQSINVQNTFPISFGPISNGNGFKLNISDPNYYLNFDLTNVTENISAQPELAPPVSNIWVHNRRLNIEIKPDPAVAVLINGVNIPDIYTISIHGVKDNCGRWLNGVAETDSPNTQIQFTLHIDQNPPLPAQAP